MVKVKTNRADSQKSEANDTKKQQAQATPVTPPATPVTSEKKGKQTSQNRKPTIGGTAVQGAKSTQPKEGAPNGAAAQQQAESYNRDMRRRMQHMGTGPYAERTSVDPRERRRKRVERLKERQDRMKHAVDTKGPSRDVKLGRRNTYFLIAVAAALVILIVVALFVNHIL
jgi:hypothetical protein